MSKTLRIALSFVFALKLVGFGKHVAAGMGLDEPQSLHSDSHPAVAISVPELAHVSNDVHCPDDDASRSTKLQAWRANMKKEQPRKGDGDVLFKVDASEEAATPSSDPSDLDAPCSVEIHSPTGSYYIYSRMFSLQASISQRCGIKRFSAGMAGGDEPLPAIEISMHGVTIHPKRRHLMDHFLFIDAFPALFEQRNPATCNLTITVLRGDHVYGRAVLAQAHHDYEVSYSELGQDLWVARRMLELLPGHVGFWLEIGAFSGFHLSNTVALEQRGWTGISVEPFPEGGSFEARAGMRYAGRHRLVKAAVLGEERQVMFVASKDGGARAFGGVLDFQLVDGKSIEHVLTLGGLVPEGELVPLQSRSPHSILQEQLQEGPRPCLIHYLSLDSEGSEIDILQAFPFEHYRVAALTVEAQEGAERRKQLVALMSAKGLRRDAASVGRDLYFVTERNVEHVPACKLKDE